MLRGQVQRASVARSNLSVPRNAVSRKSRPSSVSVRAASAEYESLKGVSVINPVSEEPVELLSLWQAEPGTRVIVPFLTHFADLSSWEYGQQLVKVLPSLESAGIKVIAVGLGSTSGAREFSRIIGFPIENLYADPSGACYKALDYSPGFGADVDVSPYAKLLPMLMGIGSPGTVEEVLRGYLGDKNAKPVFNGSSLFDVLGQGYQRPFELATLRLYNMAGILPKWQELSPPNANLLTQQGGTLVFNGDRVTFSHKDTGILKYANVEQVLRSVLTDDQVASTISSLTAQSFPPSTKPGGSNTTNWV